MLQPVKLANAVTLVSVLCHIIYIVVVLFAPDLIHIYIGSMTPAYDISLIESAPGINWPFTLMGLALMAVSVWVFVFLSAWLYDRFVK